MFTDLVYCYTNMHKYPFDMRACVKIMNAVPQEGLKFRERGQVAMWWGTNGPPG